MQDGPLRVRLVVERRISGGRGLPTSSTRSVLEVTRASGTIRVPATCREDAQLAGDGGADRFAYRCVEGQPWRVVLLTRDEGFELCGEPAGAGPAPRFEGAPARFEAAIGELGRCADDWPRPTQARLFDAVAELGEPATLELLYLTRGAHLWEWRDRALRLSEESRAKLAERLRPYLARDATADLAACRAIGLVPEDDPPLASVAPARRAELVGAPPEGGFD